MIQYTRLDKLSEFFRKEEDIMSEVIQTIKDRRSCRKYKDTMIPKEDISEIIEAGLYAASGMGRQSTIILAITIN